MQSSRQEISYINSMKAIGMFLVAFAHLEVPALSSLFINSFSMPLFFAVSGFLISTKTYSFKTFLGKKAKTLLIPYVFFASVTFCFWFFLERKFGNVPSDVPVTNYLTGIALAIPDKAYLGFNIPIWFLPSLFCAEILFFLIHKYLGKYSIAICVVFFGIGMALKAWLPFRLPYGLDVACFALIFLETGYFLQTKNSIQKYISGRPWAANLFYGLAFAAVTFIVASLNDENGHVNMYLCSFNNYLLFLVTAFAGVFSLFFLGNCIPKNKISDFFGRNTLVILGFHLMMFSLIKGVLHFLFKMDLSIFFDAFFLNLALNIAAFILFIPVIIGLNRYVPFLLGRPYKARS